MPPALGLIPRCLIAAPKDDAGGLGIPDCPQLEHPVIVVDICSSQWATHNVMILRPDERPHWLTWTDPLRLGYVPLGGRYPFCRISLDCIERWIKHIYMSDEWNEI